MAVPLRVPAKTNFQKQFFLLEQPTFYLVILRVRASFNPTFVRDKIPG